MLSIRKISANEDYSVQDLKAFLLSSESLFIVAYSDEQFAGMASAKILNKPNGDIWLYIDEVDVINTTVLKRTIV